MAHMTWLDQAMMGARGGTLRCSGWGGRRGTPRGVRTLWPLLLGLVMWHGQLGWAATEQGATSGPARGLFLRYESLGRDQGRVQTGVRVYERADGVRVTLLAAVHVADGAYYKELQRRFDTFEALLYEMVREGGAKPGDEIVSDHPVSQVQMGLRSMLALEFQMEAIDYGRPHFVHADLDPNTFAELQKKKGESILGLMIRAFFEEQSRQINQPTDTFQLLAALLSPDRAHGLKLFFGQQMEHLEELVAGIDQGADGQGSVLVSARNAHALKVMEEQINKGRKNLGIFYGAGHMLDLKRRLESAGFRERSAEWLTAWDIRRQPKAAPPSSR